jgi:hypothetical protein
MRANLSMLAALLGLGSLTACQTTAAFEPAPAIFAGGAGDKTLSQLTQAVSGALGGQSVQLAPDVLSKSSVLILETKLPQSLNERRDMALMNDRARPRPDHFELMTTGRECYLIHRETKAKIVLPGVKCQLA